MQRPSSIEDQIRKCRAAAEEKGWVVLDEFIRSDSELTGRTLVGREGIADLVRLAKQRPLPFDCVLIEDTSRLSRYVPDALRECDVFKHHGVFIYFVSDRLDSRDEDSFRIVHLVKSYGDERSVKEQGKKIHRGQEGRVLKGYTAGSRRYGYRNVPIPDENRKATYSRPFIIGVKQEVIPEQAQIVRHIMEMRASGLSFGRIAKTLKTEGIAPPGNAHVARVQGWYASTIKEITNNELYRGWRVWNRTQNVLNQAEGHETVRKRPQSEWIRVEVPELRIISDELWGQVQEVNRRGRDRYYARRLGGMNRTEASRKYLFSGVLVCGICGGNFTSIGGKAPNVRYGCPNYRFRDICTNKVTILRTRLEQQLISALSRNLLNPELEEYRVQQFSGQLKATLENEEKLASEIATNGSQLKEERAELQRQAANLVDGLAKHGLSSFISAQLKTVESRLAGIERLLAPKPAPKLRAFSDHEIRAFLRKDSQEFCEILVSDPERAKQEIQKRITKLVLTPTNTTEGWRLEVSGDVALLVGDGVMVNNALEGIAQHYTHPVPLVFNAILDPRLPLAA